MKRDPDDAARRKALVRLTAECGLGVEKRLRKLSGVRGASINPAAGSATLDYDERAAIQGLK